MHFGEHITIDGYGGDPELLNDRDVVLSVFTELCTELHMQALSKPELVEAPDTHLKDPGGWSGYIIIAESHISVHTFPKRRFISADVYTCKNGVDEGFVIEYFRKKFALEEVEAHFIKRGTKYPEHNLA